MKVLITGHTGFIGNNISKILFDKRIEVIGLSRKKINNAEYFSFQLEQDLLKPNLVEIRDLEEIGILKNIDVIIHTASILATQENIRTFSLFYENVKIIENVINISEIIKPKQIINLSSIAVYPNIDGNFNEDYPIYIAKNAEGIYGLSKFCSENLFDFFLSQSTNIVHLRLAQVIGEGMRQDRIYSIMKSELQDLNQITVWGAGERISNFIAVQEVIKVIEFFIYHQEYKGIYNLGNKNISYKELAQQLIDHFGDEKSNLILLDRGVKSKFYLNTNKLDQLLAENGQIINND